MRRVTAPGGMPPGALPAGFKTNPGARPGVKAGAGPRARCKMSEKTEILDYLMTVVGEEGCGVACSEAEIFKDAEGWKMMLEGFMAPWPLGKTAAEAKERIREYAEMGFGLS
jgi:hypothetical protein